MTYELILENGNMECDKVNSCRKYWNLSFIIVYFIYCCVFKVAGVLQY